MTPENNRALLPSGFLDLLPPEAEAEAQAINTLMKAFSSFGYQRVKPPLVEFEDSLLAPGPGAALARQTFRLMDPLSQRMMGLRADTTAQIARVAASRMAKDCRPLRLSYAADVLRVNGGQIRPERQFCQVGCELIGPDHPANDIEACLVALVALAALGIEDLSIDLTVPTLVEHIYGALGVEEEDKKTLDSLLETRDRDAIAKTGGKMGAVLAALADCSGLADEALKKLKKCSLPPEARKDADTLAVVVEGLASALEFYGLKNVSITIDPLERRGFEYQTGVSFTFFSRAARGELGRGGLYDVCFDKAHLEPATGFTLYMDTIRTVLAGKPVTKRLAVDRAEPWDVVQRYQKDGWAIVRGGDKTCTHTLSNGKITEEKR